MRDWPKRPTPMWSKAVLLDRDGTISVDTHFPHRVEELEFLPRALDALRLLASLPLHIIIVSNQAGIALELFTKREMSTYNAELRRQVEASGGRIDAFYYCPHKEPKHLQPGESTCKCAKPAPGMLLEAQEDFNLDLRSSFMVGDKYSDIEAGASVGCQTFLVSTGKGGRENDKDAASEPTYRVPDLFVAASQIEMIAVQMDEPEWTDAEDGAA